MDYQDYLKELGDTSYNPVLNADIIDRTMRIIEHSARGNSNLGFKYLNFEFIQGFPFMETSTSTTPKTLKFANNWFTSHVPLFPFPSFFDEVAKKDCRVQIDNVVIPRTDVREDYFLNHESKTFYVEKPMTAIEVANSLTRQSARSAVRQFLRQSNGEYSFEKTQLDLDVHFNSLLRRFNIRNDYAVAQYAFSQACCEAGLGVAFRFKYKGVEADIHFVEQADINTLVFNGIVQHRGSLSNIGAILLTLATERLSQDNQFTLDPTIVTQPSGDDRLSTYKRPFGKDEGVASWFAFSNDRGFKPPYFTSKGMVR